MTGPKLVSPMLDNFAIGDPISSHHGVICCPAMEKDNDTKYILKVISLPASQTQLDALLITGAYPSLEAALAYYMDQAKQITDEADALGHLSGEAGFLPFEKYQLVPKEDGTGFDIYLLSAYRRTLQKQFRRQPLTYLSAVNLGLDICSALSVCRENGYLYTDLKPSNIYITDDGAYHIGDLGFIRLRSLKYASLPDKYRSAYTAPEVNDAFCDLNDKIDIYALGLILYQVYNNGHLPFAGDVAPDEEFPAPPNADHEMAQIILKACSPRPENRWSDPDEMRHALIQYMQRVGANNTPIASSVPQEPEEDPTDAVLPEETESPNGIPEDTVGYAEYGSEILEESGAESQEDILSAVDDEPADPESGLYDESGDDISEILEKADALAAHEVPDAAAIAEELRAGGDDEEPAADSEDPTAPPSPRDSAAGDGDAPAAVEVLSGEETDDMEDIHDIPPQKKGHTVRNTIICILLLLLLGGGIFYYRNYYLLPVESLTLSGEEDRLTVSVSTEVEESLLTVICSDAYGNKVTAPVKDGKAVFTQLVPNTAYTVKLSASGLHRLVGSVSTAYSTPMKTSLAQFSAVTGSEDGSAVVGFTVEGPDSQQWILTYSAEGEEEKTITFPDHMATVTGLTIGKEYTFTLTPEDKLYFTGENTVKHIASVLVYPQSLRIDSCLDGVLVTSWKAPKDTEVSGWVVRCTDGVDYNQTITTTELTATFEGIDSGKEYAVEVSAVGMSVSQRVLAAAGAPTATEFQADTSGANEMVLSWKLNKELAASEIQVVYTIGGFTMPAISVAEAGSAVISPVIPDTDYTITLQKKDGSVIFGSPFDVHTPKAGAFSCTYNGYTLSADKMIVRMCRTPNKEGWSKNDVADGDYTTTYSVGEKASFLLESLTRYGISSDPIATTVVIRQEDGKVVSVDTQTRPFSDMWNKNFCEVDIPALPSAAGKYTASIYMNGAPVFDTAFTVQE